MAARHPGFGVFTCVALFSYSAVPYEQEIQIDGQGAYRIRTVCTLHERTEHAAPLTVEQALLFYRCWEISDRADLGRLRRVELQCSNLLAHEVKS